MSNTDATRQGARDMGTRLLAASLLGATLLAGCTQAGSQGEDGDQGLVQRVVGLFGAAVDAVRGDNTGMDEMQALDGIPVTGSLTPEQQAALFAPAPSEDAP